MKPPRAAAPAVAALSIVFGAILMAWPAIYSGYPLMYPDSVGYIRAGRPVAAAILLGHRSHHYGIRSLIYSLGILPFHVGDVIWPIIAFQCLLSSWVLWLVFRSVLPTSKWWYFVILIGMLSSMSSLSWFGSFVMPDILGPLLSLCIYLLVFAFESLSRIEKTLVCVISWWSICSHATHLLIALALCCAMAVVAIAQPQGVRRYSRRAVRVGIIIALAIGAQLSLNAFLYGKASLNGDRPPFLAARLIGDGPGQWFLEKHCPEDGWELCHYLNNLSGTSNRFLWSRDGVWMNASLSSRAMILQQEGPFAEAVLREYPREQFLRFGHNFLAQLSFFELGDFKPNPDIVLELQRDRMGTGRYLESREACDQLYLDFFYRVHWVALITSLAGIAVFLPCCYRRRPRRLIALGYVVGSSVIVNALVTGTLSMVDGRYESRVIWLVPMFAGLCFLGWLQERRAAEP
jgi:hypothetical protein